MYNSTDTGARRPVIFYIIIAIALFAALILTVRWAKSRADYYGQQPQTGQGQTVAEQPQESQPQGVPEETQQQPAASSSQQSQPPQLLTPRSTPESTASAPTPRTVANTGPPVVQVVPSTGPEQLILPIVSLSAVVFAGLSYVRARRRYTNQVLAK